MDRLTNLLSLVSNGRYKCEKALEIKQLAKDSIGRVSDALSFELTQVIAEVQFIQKQINALDMKLKELMKAAQTPLLGIPGISYRLAAVILAEIGDIHRFRSPDQLLAFAGLDPSTYQSGKFKADKTPMVKHGSTYLRWALMQAARFVARRCPEFHRYMEHKLAQGKHYFVALGHLTKKLVRVIFHILSTNEMFVLQTA